MTWYTTADLANKLNELGDDATGETQAMLYAAADRLDEHVRTINRLRIGGSKPVLVKR